ncbi:MAG: NADH-quinone oxidoreductase subunit N [Candidatus Riflebacteria bacterium]|nr:NADH-quinone oxidoreductase subunit N [Candidatus Riflebacteria bacterium]
MSSWLQASNWLVMLPEMIIAFFALIILLVAAFTKDSEAPYPESLAITGLALAFISSYYIPEGVGYYGQVAVDSVSRTAFSIAILGGMLVLGVVPSQFGTDTMRSETSALVLFSLCGVGFMVTAQHLIMLFLGIELLSLPLYIMAGMRTRDPRSREAALKYFIVGAFASALMLFGMAIYLGANGDLLMNHFALSFQKNAVPPTLIFFAGWILISTAMLFKLGAVPFHMWVLDVYQGSPSSITAFMTFAPKIAAFFALAKMWPLGSESGLSTPISMMYLLSFLTMTAGNMMALMQRNIKRMLAYSSIAHGGYMLMAFLISGTEGIHALLFYLAVYALMNIGAFTVITLVAPSRDPELSIISLSGLAKTHTYLAVALAICLFSLTGLPPFGGFMAKFFLIKAVLASGNVYIALAAIFNSLLSAYYYLRVVLVMTTREPLAADSDELISPSAGFTSIGLSSRIALAVAIIGVVISGISPDFFARIISL